MTSCSISFVVRALLLGMGLVRGVGSWDRQQKKTIINNQVKITTGYLCTTGCVSGVRSNPRWRSSQHHRQVRFWSGTEADCGRVLRSTHITKCVDGCLWACSQKHLVTVKPAFNFHFSREWGGIFPLGRALCQRLSVREYQKYLNYYYSKQAYWGTWFWRRAPYFAFCIFQMHYTWLGNRDWVWERLDWGGGQARYYISNMYQYWYTIHDFGLRILWSLKRKKNEKMRGMMTSKCLISIKNTVAVKQKKRSPQTQEGVTWRKRNEE